MKTKTQLLIVSVLMVMLLALVPNATATGYMNGSDWTGINSILNDLGFGVIFENTASYNNDTWDAKMSSPATTNLEMLGYSVLNATNYTTSQGRHLENGGCDASYCIRYNLTNSSIIEAINGSTGVVDFSGMNFSLVVQNAFNQMSKTGKMQIDSSLTGVTIPATIDMNLTGLRGFTLISDAYLTPIAGIGDAFFIHNGYGATIQLKFSGGGQWSTNDNAVHIRGIREGRYTVFGNDYAGTVLNFSVNGTGEPKTAKNIVDLLQGQNIGRTLCVCGDGSLWSSAFGTLKEVWSFGSTHENLISQFGDVSIGKLEGDVIKFESCSAVFVDTLWVANVTIENGGNLHFSKIGTDSSTSTGDGVYIGNVTSYTYGRGVTIMDLQTRDSDGAGLKLYNARSVVVNLKSWNDSVGFVSSGTLSSDNIITVDINTARTNGTEIQTGTSRTKIGGYIAPVNSSGEASKSYGLIINSTGTVELNGLIIEGSAAQTSALYITQSANYVNMVAGWIAHPTNKSYGYNPRGVTNIYGLSPFNFGVLSTAPTPEGFGDSYSNSTSGELFCKYGTQWMNATGNTTVC